MRLIIFLSVVCLLGINGQPNEISKGVTNSIEKGLELVDVKRDAFDGVTLPDWLKSSDASNEKGDDETRTAILNELTNDGEKKVTLTGDELETVNRFIKALKGISNGEQKLTKRESNHIKELDDVCKDRRDDCLTYEDYCSSHKDTMETECAKTCGFCHACDDIGRKAYCAQIKYFNLCGRDEAQKYCAKSCGVCENECGNSVHGCCSDKKTLKENEEGSNCPVCKDKFDNVCIMFKNDCDNYSGAGQWLTKNCPVTCGLCEETATEHIVGSCRDEPLQKEFCPLWRNAGWCLEKRNLMKTYCARTCQLCNMK